MNKQRTNTCTIAGILLYTLVLFPVAWGMMFFACNYMTSGESAILQIVGFLLVIMGSFFCLGLSTMVPIALLAYWLVGRKMGEHKAFVVCISAAVLGSLLLLPLALDKGYVVGDRWGYSTFLVYLLTQHVLCYGLSWFLYKVVYSWQSFRELLIRTEDMMIGFMTGRGQSDRAFMDRLYHVFFFPGILAVSYMICQWWGGFRESPKFFFIWGSLALPYYLLILPKCWLCRLIVKYLCRLTNIHSKGTGAVSLLWFFFAEIIVNYTLINILPIVFLLEQSLNSVAIYGPQHSYELLPPLESAELCLPLSLILAWGISAMMAEARINVDCEGKCDGRQKKL